ncbi:MULTISPECIES: hypothetical protein [Enterococcus]|uniref:hypothetical protein n=1 Tax=Bacteria TaxID=2 RepID=UPI000760FD6E|nr:MULTISPECIES: hypothetical protein [Enterococcus]WCG31239.1 hypothetical protein PML73_05085 [Enterococcus faecalis]CAI3490988.1 hypothetical protein CIRMBP1312_01957 [Enterococcus cecorum]HBI1617070.1 hypothetical protein [Enterococcus faecalis]
MKNIDMEIYNYIEKRVEKTTSVSFERVYNYNFDEPLLQIIIKNGRIKEFIHYDYRYIKSLDAFKEHLDMYISNFNKRVNRRNKKHLD